MQQKLEIPLPTLVTSVLAIMISSISALWISLNLLVVDPLNQMRRELETFKIMYAEEVTELKTRVAQLERNH